MEPCQGPQRPCAPNTLCCGSSVAALKSSSAIQSSSSSKMIIQNRKTPPGTKLLAFSLLPCGLGELEPCSSKTPSMSAGTDIPIACRCRWPCLPRHCPTLSLSLPSSRWHTRPYCALASLSSTRWHHRPSCAGFCSITKPRCHGHHCAGFSFSSTGTTAGILLVSSPLRWHPCPSRAGVSPFAALRHVVGCRAGILAGAALASSVARAVVLAGIIWRHRQNCAGLSTLVRLALPPIGLALQL